MMMMDENQRGAKLRPGYNEGEYKEPEEREYKTRHLRTSELQRGSYNGIIPSYFLTSEHFCGCSEDDIKFI